VEWLILWAIFGLVGAAIANSKGSSGLGGFLFGILLGPIGWLLILVFAGPKMGRCSQCKSRIPRDELRCPRCGVDFTAAAAGVAPSAATKVCPECAETVQAAARICRFCRHEFTTG